MIKILFLLVEPRLFDEIPKLISEYYNHLPNWNFVFYCCKNTIQYWRIILRKYNLFPANYVEIRELEIRFVIYEMNINVSLYIY